MGEHTELQRLEAKARELAQLINYVLAERAREHPQDRGVGFVLWLFTFGAGGWATYLSNANREDMIVALKELLEKLEKLEADRREAGGGGEG